MSDEVKNLKRLLRELSNYVGYAACCGNKCRLPHCYSCGATDVAVDKLTELEMEIAAVLYE